MENEMRSISEDIQLCLQELRRKCFLLVLVALLGLILGVVCSLFVSGSTYQASACIYNAKFISYYETTAIDNFLQNAQTLTQSYKIAENAVALLNEGGYTVSEVQRSISMTAENDSSVVWLSCESPSPQRAIQIVNAFTEALVTEMKSMSGTDSIQVLEYAKTAGMTRNPASIRLLIITALPVAFLSVGCLIVVLRMLLSPRILSLDRCTLNGQINLLGVIPEIQKETGGTRGKRNKK